MTRTHVLRRATQDGSERVWPDYSERTMLAPHTFLLHLDTFLYTSGVILEINHLLNTGFF